MSFWPKKQDFQDILISSLWAFLTWIIWSIIIIILTFFIYWTIGDINTTLQSARAWTKTSAIFPLILSFITLIWTSISCFLTYYILNITSPTKYKKNIIIFWQIAFFQVFTYIFIAPIYIYTWIISYDNILIIHLVHILLLIFWVNIILDILNNYRYVLVGLYGSFLGLFISSSVTIIIFNVFSEWYAKLVSLIILLPLINFFSIFFKQIFELLYYKYYKMTSLDQIWDIFFQIELEEKEKLKELEEKNTI